MKVDITRCLCVILTSLLCGCAAFSGSLNVNSEWASGKVLDTGPGDAFDVSLKDDCKPPSADDDVNGRRFAKVRFRVGRSSMTRIVPFQLDQLVHAGDTVYVSLAGCRISTTRPS